MVLLKGWHWDWQGLTHLPETWPVELNTLSQFADNTNLSGVDETLEGTDLIQRDLDRPERWECTNVVEFNKCKVWHVGQGNVKHKDRLGGEWIESNPGEPLGNLVHANLAVT